MRHWNCRPVPTFAVVLDQDRARWGRDPRLPFCEDCLNMLLDYIDEYELPEPHAIKFIRSGAVR